MARNKLKETLQKEGITQAQLSAKSGVSSGTVNKLCNGNREVSPTIQAKLLKALISLAGRNYSQKDIFK